MMRNSRRRFLRLGGTVFWMIPLFAASPNAFASKNQAIRTALKYQDHPGPEKKDCAGCIHFIPGNTPTALGGCKLYPVDSEISPKGYCTAWVKKP